MPGYATCERDTGSIETGCRRRSPRTNCTPRNLSGKKFLLAPVGVDEGWSVAEKITFVRKEGRLQKNSAFRSGWQSCPAAGPGMWAGMPWSTVAWPMPNSLPGLPGNTLSNTCRGCNFRCRGYYRPGRDNREPDVPDTHVPRCRSRSWCTRGKYRQNFCRYIARITRLPQCDNASRFALQTIISLD